MVVHEIGAAARTIESERGTRSGPRGRKMAIFIIINPTALSTNPLLMPIPIHHHTAVIEQKRRKKKKERESENENERENVTDEHHQ